GTAPHGSADRRRRSPRRTSRRSSCTRARRRPRRSSPREARPAAPWSSGHVCRDEMTVPPTQGSGVDVQAPKELPRYEWLTADRQAQVRNILLGLALFAGLVVYVYH